jgi:hypothetical protein
MHIVACILPYHKKKGAFLTTIGGWSGDRWACGGTTATSGDETRSSLKRKSMKVLQNEAIAIEKELNYVGR